MNRRGALFILIVIAGFFVFGLSWLYRLRLSGGDVYPPYSSLRADPLGTRAFYEALENQPDVSVNRWLKPLVQLPNDSGRTLVLAGMTRESWKELANQEAQALDAAAIAGARVVIVFAAELEPEVADTPSPAEKKRDDRLAKEKEKRLLELPERLRPADWKTRWNIELRRRLFLDRELGAMRRPGAPSHLPLTVPWKSDLFLSAGEGSEWKTIYARAGYPVVMERLRGRGSLVLATDAFFLSNEAMTTSRLPQILAWTIGENRRVSFVESHLGLAEDLGIAALARRYGLTGCFLVLVLGAGLWIWKRMALFVPPTPTPNELALNYQQTAGLEALLRRAVPPKQLISTCVSEWKTHARGRDVERLEQALATAPSSNAADAYNAAVQALKKRR